MAPVARPPAELLSLAEELDDRWGRVTRVTLNPAHWPTVPRRIPVAGRTVHAGRFTVEQDEHMIMVCSYAPRRLNLLVVPPETDVVDAARLMSEAADPANVRTASALLAAQTHGGAAQPQAPAYFLPSAVAPSAGVGEAGRRADLTDAGPPPGRCPRSRGTGMTPVRPGPGGSLA